jgi:NADH-quinone oxidoreductase subunit F
MESLEGKKGSHVQAAVSSRIRLYGRPTTINNTETYASVPAILRKGGEWFLGLGKANNGGPKIFSVSGHVNKPAITRSGSARHSPSCLRWPAACATVTS